MKNKIRPVILAISACLGGGLLIVSHHPAPGISRAAKTAPAGPAVPAVIPQSASVQPVAATDNAASNIWLSTPAEPASRRKSPGAAGTDIAAANPPLTINGYVVQDPVARVALNLVGIDPDAEAYWAQAINDPDLPAEERKDLIEDLNEDGLSDPKHPDAEDLQIIANRLQLINQMAPYATDPVNIAALNEAGKDLLNLYNGLPVD